MMINEYFDWMYESVNTDPDGNLHDYYKDLLHYLHSISFNYLIPMDSNREGDGITLRYHFAYEKNIPSSVVASEIDIYPCSVLEMMVALSRRMESDVMGDVEFGNRTYIWFHSMLSSMGLENFVDGEFGNIERGEAGDIVSRCLNREYGYNGEGGFFTLANPSRDLRSVEIWDQAMWWLNEYEYGN